MFTSKFGQPSLFVLKSLEYLIRKEHLAVSPILTMNPKISFECCVLIVLRMLLLVVLRSTDVNGDICKSVQKFNEEMKHLS